ncbi:MAG: SUMF1/EgtB/PvdO family nonheme iron enzyme [Deltaproteobacteria bacterium]|nr:SUMF1/EgtB/PvdO family nonheme iron enzyme [Deltaproteobacteria bacterium]
MESLPAASPYCLDHAEATNAEVQIFCKKNPHSIVAKSRACQPPPTGMNNASQPAVGFNWKSAQAYCRALGKRLPTNAEWEKGAEGPQGYPFGTHDGEISKSRAHYDAQTTALVCSYPPNGYELCDMSGNVYEWTAEKVLRGGAWVSSSGDKLKVDLKTPEDPKKESVSTGVRCAISLPVKK